MSSSFLLNWAILAVSLTNTILMLWLGLTVLLNAERRTWGAWVAGGGLLLGGVFFISHTAILAYDFSLYNSGLNFWWQIGWGPVLALPFVWYVIMLWYTGFWDDHKTQLHSRQRLWFPATTVLLLALFALMLIANPVPSFSQFTLFGLAETPSLGGIPLVVILYSIYVILTISLSIDALRRPAPSGRVMGDLARQRARPWLAATSFIYLLVGLLVVWAMLWIVQNASSPEAFLRETRQTNVIAWFDFWIASLIGISVLLLGQAVVAYEIFTGTALPRRGFLRHWRLAIVLAIGYGVMVSFSFNIPIHQIYSMLLTTLLMTIFYALFSWRSYTERERYIDHLRPFVTSQGLFTQLLTPGTNAPTPINVNTPFEALCKEILDASVAYLVPLGPLAPLVGSAISYPTSQKLEFTGLIELMAAFTTPQPTITRLDPTKFHGASWAVPLWSERGQIGVLLLGEKRDGGLYTQEEIEIAQTSAERLIDTKASAEIAQRLMVLQRQRMAESQLLDQRARRVLHDDVLQQLHTAMLKLVAEKSRPNGGTSEAIELLADVHSQISDLLHDMPTTTLPEITQLGLIGALRKVIDEELGSAFESVKWQIDLQAEREVQHISPLTAEVLFYATREAIRNAARHGRHADGLRPLHLVIHFKWENGLEIQIEDDGIGITTERSVSSGSGQGLALHSTMMAVVGGELAVESEPGEYTKVSLILPQGV